jgi:tRNA(adenine34) deaminase
MCAGALFWTQIGRIVIGARDEKRGFARLEPAVTHPKTKVEFGLMGLECEEMIKDFFKEMRRNNF